MTLRNCNSTETAVSIRSDPKSSHNIAALIVVRFSILFLNIGLIDTEEIYIIEFHAAYFLNKVFCRAITEKLCDDLGSYQNKARLRKDWNCLLKVQNR